jgi:hypothetical protein
VSQNESTRWIVIDYPITLDAHSGELIGLNPKFIFGRIEVTTGVTTGSPSPKPAAVVEEALRAKIMGLVRPKNWDGFGAEPVTNGACLAGLTFVGRTIAKGLPKPLMVSPSVHGAVHFQWEKNDNLFSVQIRSGFGKVCRVRWAGKGGRGVLDCGMRQAVVEMTRLYEGA